MSLGALAGCGGSSSSPPIGGTPAKLSVTFLGDSQTYLWKTAEAFPMWDTKNAGVSGDTSKQMLARLPALLVTPPNVLVVMAGTNDVYLWRDEASIESLQRIVDLTTAEGTMVVVLTIPPMVAPTVRDVTKWNKEVKSLRGARVIDFYSSVSTRPDALLSDGVHLSGLGYSIAQDLLYKL